MLDTSLNEVSRQLLAVREHRVLRALRELAARRQSAAACKRALCGEEAALRQLQQEHKHLDERLYESARAGTYHALQLCAELACVQAAADRVAQQRTVLAAARRALHGALSELRTARRHAHQAGAARERVSLLRTHTHRTALLRRNLCEELGAEEVGLAVSAAASARAF